MEKKSLFNEYEAYTEDGSKVSDEFKEAVKPIFKKWADRGYHIRDIELIAIDITTFTAAYERISRSLKERKK